VRDDLAGSLSTSARDRKSGTTRFTKTQAERRSSNRSRSPVKSISRAVFAREVCARRRLRRGAENPALDPGSANWAVSLATGRSHIATRWQPAATGRVHARDHGLGQAHEREHHLAAALEKRLLPGFAGVRAHLAQVDVPRRSACPRRLSTTSFVSRSFARRSSSACSPRALRSSAGSCDRRGSASASPRRPCPRARRKGASNFGFARCVS